MLRKTASTLWTRFVPAARQAYPAAASSMKRVRHRSRAIARVSARAMRLRFFFLIASLTLSRLSNTPSIRSPAGSPRPPRTAARTAARTSRSTKTMKRNGNTTSTRYVERRVTVIARASVAPPPVVVVVAHALFVSFSPQPPLNLFGLPARYASAVYTAASKEGVLERVQSEIKTVRALGTPPTPRRGANSGASDRPRRERSKQNLVRLDFVVWSVSLLPARLPPRVSDPLFVPPPSLRPRAARRRGEHGREV